MNTISRQNLPKGDTGHSVGRIFVWTTMLRVVFSAGIITGQRILLEQNLPPMLSIGQPSSGSTVPALNDDERDKEEVRPSIFSFYDALTSPEVQELAEAPTPESIEARPTPAPPAEEENPAEEPDAPEPEPEPEEQAEAVPTPEEVVEGSDTDEAPVTDNNELPARYTLQVASHPSIEQARSEMDRLRTLGLDPHVVAADVPGQGNFYRVRIGKFHTMDEARASQGTVQADQSVQTFVTPL